jgi:hypothetical protein
VSRRISILGCLAVLAFTSIGLPACAAAEEDAGEDEAAESAVVSSDLSAASELALARRLPSTPELDAWYASVAEMETALANGDPRFTLEPNRGGGTSAYVQVKRDGKTIGAFLPENSATVPLGEVRAFQLARALGAASHVGPGVFHRLKGAGLARLKTIMESERYSGAKEENRKKIVAKLAANPGSLLGVFKDWTGPRPVDYESLAKGGAPNGKINESDPIVKLLKSSAARPSTEPVSLPGVANAKAPEIDLAKQLSTLMLIDALNGQWDRFSGGNMHCFVENGVVRFVTLDNGGVTTSGAGLAGTYRELILTKWVTRYDRETAQKITALNAAASGTGEALGFTDPAALRDALMMSDKEWKHFKDILGAVAKAVSVTSEASFF